MALQQRTADGRRLAEHGGIAVLHRNKNGDEIFSVSDSKTLFDRLPGKHNRLSFSDGLHDEWPDELIEESLQSIEAHAHGDPGIATYRAEPAPGT